MLVVFCKAHFGGLFCCPAKSLTHRRKAVFYILEPDMAGGRPTDYNTDVADSICARIAEGESLRSICRCEGMPNIRSVMRWLGIHPEFSQQYAHAREEQADKIFDELLEIADDGRNDWIEKEQGSVVDHEHVSRSKLRIDTRKWMLARMAPKKYGDATNIKLSGDSENPLNVLLSEISGNTLKPK